MKDFFSVLGLTRRASDREIREAYRRLAKQYHPDSSSVASAERMHELNDAKEILFDPIKREEHRVLLGFQENFSRERLSALRTDPRFQTTSRYAAPPVRPPQSARDAKWRKNLTGVIIA